METGVSGGNQFGPTSPELYPPNKGTYATLLLQNSKSASAQAINVSTLVVDMSEVQEHGHNVV